MKPRLGVFNVFEANNTKELPNARLILTAQIYEKCEHCKFTLRLELRCTRNPNSNMSRKGRGFTVFLLVTISRQRDCVSTKVCTGVRNGNPFPLLCSTNSGLVDSEGILHWPTCKGFPALKIMPGRTSQDICARNWSFCHVKGHILCYTEVWVDAKWE